MSPAPSSEIDCPVAVWATRSPQGLALRTPEGAITWREWNNQIAAAEHALVGVGVHRGSRVAFVLPNSTTTLTLLVALFRIGAVACPIDPKAPPAYRAALLSTLSCDRILATESDLPSPGRSTEAPQMPRWQCDAPATFIFTSGSTGSPKAVALSLGNHLACAEAANRNIPLAPNDTWLLSLPIHHVAGFGILFRCLRAGATIALPGDLLLETAIHTSRATHISLVARQLARLLDAPPLPRLRAILLGGSAIPGPLLDHAVSADLPIHTSYGMTEMATQITATPPNAARATLNSSGFPLIPGTIRLGTTGCIEVNGPARFLGYWDRNKLIEPFDRDGWFTTSDRGYFDTDGALHVTGRMDNLFVAGGENIQPEEIERALLQLPGIGQAIVVPIDHPEFGATPVAFVDQTALLDQQAIRDALAKRLPAYKIPRQIFPWPHAIIQAGLKLNRAAFAEEAAHRVSAP